MRTSQKLRRRLQWPWMSADAAQQAAGTAETSARFAWSSLHAWYNFWLRGLAGLLGALVPRRLAVWREKQS